MTSNFYFVHIPKTAGTSFRQVLDRTTNARHVYTHRSEDVEGDYKEYAVHMDWEKYDAIRGHFSYALAEFLPPKYEMITMLRDPVERLISHCNHMLNDTNQLYYYKGQIFRNIENGDLTKIFQDAEFRSAIANLQTKHIGWTYGFLGKKLRVNGLKFHGFLGDLTSEEYEKLLDAAKDHLLSMKFFGIQDYFEQSILLFYLTYGYPYKYEPTPHAMKFPYRPKRESLDPELLALYESISTYDYQLFEFGLQEFKKRYMVHLRRLAKSLLEPVPVFEDVEAVKYLLDKKQRVSKHRPLVRRLHLQTAWAVNKAKNLFKR